MMIRKSKRRPMMRTRVLIVLSADGFVELFGERGIEALVALRLDVPQHCEAAADTYLTATLPRRWRDLFYPGKLRATGLVEKLTPEQALSTLHKLQELRELRALREDLAPKASVPAAIQRRKKTS
jgi:hypothetical protein